MAGKYVNTDKGRRWQNADGTYAFVKPGGGAQFGAEFIEFLAPGTNQRTAEIDQKTRDLSGRTINTPPTFMKQTAPNFMQQQLSGGPRPNNADEINARLAQQKKEREAALAVTKGDYDHSSGGFTGQDVAFVPDSTLDNNNGGGGGNRNSERTNANGIVQKGTDMSRSFNDLLATTNTSGYQPFGSNQLPTTAGSPDSKVSPKTKAILAGIQAGKETDMSIEGYQEPTSSRTAAQNSVLAGIQGGQKTDQGIEGYKKPGSTSRLDAALNDKEGINSYMSKFSSGDRERAANRAFLDTEDSMLALRAKEAVNNVVYANQRHYIPGENADSPAVAITRDQARGISNGRTNAQDLLKAHIARNKDAGTETPAEAQDPLTPAASVVKSNFDAAQKTDFELNNNSGGADKPGQQTIDSDFMESVDFSDPTQLAEYERRMSQLK